MNGTLRAFKTVNVPFTAIQARNAVKATLRDLEFLKVAFTDQNGTAQASRSVATSSATASIAASAPSPSALMMTSSP